MDKKINDKDICACIKDIYIRMNKNGSLKNNDYQPIINRLVRLSHRRVMWRWFYHFCIYLWIHQRHRHHHRRRLHCYHHHYHHHYHYNHRVITIIVVPFSVIVLVLEYPNCKPYEADLNNGQNATYSKYSNGKWKRLKIGLRIPNMRNKSNIWRRELA